MIDIPCRARARAGARRLLRRQMIVALIATTSSLLAACASRVDIRPLATGRVDVSAYELRGMTLTPLRREVARLCPTGADVLRVTARDQQPEFEVGRIHRWRNTAALWLDPPVQQAQMMVVCKPDASDLGVTPAEKPEPVVAQAPSILPIPSILPVGPVQPQW